MGSLTQEARLVKYVNGVDPMPDHYLVVFKKVGNGRRFHATLSAGEKLRRSIFASPSSFITYAVPSDTDLRHRFNRPYQTHEQTHSFILYFTVEYRISDPRALVEKLDSDPLQRLEDEIHSAILQTTKLLSWPDIEQEQIDLEYLLFQATSGTAGTISNLEKLKLFAQAQGIEVRRIAVSRKLPKDEIRAPVVRKLEQQRREMMMAHHDTALLEQGQRQTLEAQDKGFARRQGVADGIAANTSRAISQATDGVRSFRDIHNAIGEFVGIQNTILGIASGSGQVDAGNVPSLPASPAGGLLAASASATTPLATLLAEICAHLGGMACDTNERTQMLSLALHLVAEVLRGNQKSDETLERYRKALEGKSTDLISVLSREQLKFLQRLQETPQLERELS
jgi:hypothetical protein